MFTAVFTMFHRLLNRITVRMSAGIATILLLLTFFVPSWGFSIYAPQYPEGLHMTVSLNRIEGDLQSINTLNHYVGMHPIDPASMPEMAIMPIMMGVFALALIILAIFPSRKWAVIWLGVFLLAGLIGMMDLYKWGYEFGHNLNPDAPIKIPGMAYQPPYIGKKSVLNITSYSYPHAGAISLGLAFVVLAVPLWISRKGQRGDSA